jgi:flagellar biosynthesis GTPase FlhF
LSKAGSSAKIGSIYSSSSESEDNITGAKSSGSVISGALQSIMPRKGTVLHAPSIVPTSAWSDSDSAASDAGGSIKKKAAATASGGFLGSAGNFDTFLSDVSAKTQLTPVQRPERRAAGGGGVKTMSAKSSLIASMWLAMLGSGGSASGSKAKGVNISGSKPSVDLNRIVGIVEKERQQLNAQEQQTLEELKALQAEKNAAAAREQENRNMLDRLRREKLQREKRAKEQQLELQKLLDEQSLTELRERDKLEEIESLRRATIANERQQKEVNEQVDRLRRERMAKERREQEAKEELVRLQIEHE